MTGFKGKKNLYVCAECGRGFVTEDRDEGVTPFMTTCLTDGCSSMAQSLMYGVPQEMLGNPAVLWIRPPETEWRAFGAATQNHLAQGGLIRSDKTQPSKKRNPKRKKAFRI